MSSELKPPIFLFGNTRSGTGIVQKVITAHPDIAKWNEPRTLWLCADPTRPHDEFEASDATPKAKEYIRKQFLNYQRQNGNCVVMEKTPANILKIPYVREIFPEATFLFIVRSPFSFISSVEMKWQRPIKKNGIIRRLKSTPITQLHHYAGRLFKERFDKRVLRKKYLSVWGPRYKGMDQDVQTLDRLTVIARQWAAGSRKAAHDLEAFEPGQVLRIRYEDFVEDPITDAKRIFAHCGMEMTDEVVRAANELVKSDRQAKWRRFDPQDLARIVPEIAEEMDRHGYELPLEIAQARDEMLGDVNTKQAEIVNAEC